MSEIPALRFNNLGDWNVDRLQSSIRSRIEDMYSGRPDSTPKDSGGENNLRTAGALVTGGHIAAAIPGIGPALNLLSNAGALATANTGARTKRIQELASDPKQRGTYDSGKNTYSGLNFLDQLMDIRPDAVTSQIESDRRGQLLNQPAMEELMLEYGVDDLKKIFPKGSATSNTEIEKALEQTDTRRGLISKIEGTVDGTKLLQAKRQGVDGKLSNDELRILRDEALKSTPAQKRAQELHQSTIEDGKNRRNFNDSSIRISQQNADLAATNARNELKLAEAEIAYKNSTNDYNWRTANLDRDYNWRTSEADRELKKDLALLGFKDKDADRRYDREERRDEQRQLFILQMMKGLGNLGQSIAI